MYKGGRIIAFAALFCLAVLSPFIVNLANAAPAPETSLDTPAINAQQTKECVASTEYMKDNHMQLLDEWRNDVVRDGSRECESASGQVYEEKEPGRHLPGMPLEPRGVLRFLPRLRVGRSVLLGLPRRRSVMRHRRPRRFTGAMGGAGYRVVKRRDFLIAGAALGVAGLGCLGGCSSYTGSARVSGGGVAGRHWGFVVDVERFNREADMGKIQAACHHAHNVPDIGDPKEEVKWIWGEPFEASFADIHSEHPSRELEEATVPVLCNHCEEPPVRARVPHEGHVQARRRHRGDGLPPLHRLPVLHGGLPLWRAQPELPRSGAVPRRGRSLLSHAHEGRGGEVHDVRGPHRRGRAAAVR